jgi:hypothetical protein
MLDPAFFGMAAIAAARGIRVQTNTDLTLPMPERARRCVTNGLARRGCAVVRKGLAQGAPPAMRLVRALTGHF